MNVDLMRPGNGLVRCCICFEARTPDELFTDAAGAKWDVCKGKCAKDAGHE